MPASFGRQPVSCVSRILGSSSWKASKRVNKRGMLLPFGRNSYVIIVNRQLVIDKNFSFFFCPITSGSRYLKSNSKGRKSNNLGQELSCRIRE